MGGRLKPPQRDVKDPDAIRGASAHPDLPAGERASPGWLARGVLPLMGPLSARPADGAMGQP
ncbi:hypothetical protein U876_02530 [Aeromonas hydrophila NJ-35]|nr:hypothetical protein AHML_20100 [Aeromonas hydrophila ML09-119]AHX34397.1 hypothetical protein V428_20940 [Aeromonas hydrophila subsp. hydrophila AL09-71]AHX71197.1 hypothetical protein V429_20970 [Aeromonas hydrophila pc104A]AJE38576.1 hypothetical protein V469_02545 [Aeromonas hydrophila J-1]AKJ36992.1 hypothetical protein U876_02530 [Aeromonas hydrophila NJ-35]ALQ61883.1 hypothetical protein AS145_02750 [Aeromonas hydrophila]